MTKELNDKNRNELKLAENRVNARGKQATSTCVCFHVCTHPCCHFSQDVRLSSMQKEIVLQGFAKGFATSFDAICCDPNQHVVIDLCRLSPGLT